MSSAQDFAAALDAPDDDASNRQLYLLAAQGPVASTALPKTAEAYLEAFCDRSLSIIRRRWIAIALCRMIEASKDVATHLKHLPRELLQVGSVILEATEAEETRVVAGFVIREAIAHGMLFRSFWDIPSVLNNEPAFPREKSTSWHTAFQGFVDTVPMEGSAVETAPLIMYAVAFIASDYKWYGDGHPALFVQGERVTIVTPDASIRDVEFVDIPFHHIEGITRRRSVLHDSENLQTTEMPWEIRIKLSPAQSTYHLNSSELRATELTIILPNESDADECELAIRSFLNLPPAVDSPAANESTGGPSQSSQKKEKRLVEAGKSQASDKPAQGDMAALPAISKSPLTSTMQQSQAESGVVDVYEFPEKSPRIIRQPNSKSKSISAKGGGIKVAPRESAKSTRQAKPAGTRPNFKLRTKSPATENEKDMTSLPKRTSQKQKNSPNALPKPHTKSSAAVNAGASDIFSIEAVAREERTAKKTVEYGETSSTDESSEVEDADSDYKKPKKRKYFQPAKASKSKKAVPKSKPKTARSRKIGLSGTSTKSVSVGTLKSRPPSELGPEAPSSKVQAKQPNKRDKRRTDGAEKASLAAASSVQDAPVHTNLKASKQEMNILNGLNQDESDNEHGVIIDPSPTRDRGTLSRKRPMDDDPPSTPRQTKRAKKDHVETRNPPKPLIDPSSPCNMRQQFPPIETPPPREHGMKPPPQPRAELGVHIAPPTQRQHSFIEGRTPMHRNLRRSDTGSSANVDIMSSNSKATPASPHAESTAISGHADPLRVEVEAELAVSAITQSNPFSHTFTRPIKATSFTRRLTREIIGTNTRNDIFSGEVNFALPQQPDAIPRKEVETQARNANMRSFTVEPPVKPSFRSTLGHTASAAAPVDHPVTNIATGGSAQNPIQRRVEHITHIGPEDTVLDGDTLVEEDDELPQAKFPIDIRSSPPGLQRDSPSSHSSTSAEPEPYTDCAIPTSDAEEMEWEESLLPHQRSLGEQLARVTRRVMGHIVNNETAMDDIAETYQSDGFRTLQNLADQHNSEVEALSQEMEKKTNTMKRSCDQLLRKLSHDRKRVEKYEI